MSTTDGLINFNETDGIPIHTAQVQVGHIILGIPTILLAIFGNIGTIIAFYTDSSLNLKPSDLIVLNLAFADFGMAVFTIPIFQVMVGAHGYWPWGELSCRILLSLAMVLIFAGILFVILLSWDRYMLLAMEYSDYMRKMSYKRVKIVVGVTWLAATTQALYEALTWNAIIEATPVMYRTNFNVECDCPSMKLLTGAWFCAFVFSIIPIISVIFLGWLILSKLRKRVMRWKNVRCVVSTIAEPTTKTTHMTYGNDGSVSTSSAPENPTREVSVKSNNHDDETHRNKNNQFIVEKRYVKPIITYIFLVLSLAMCTLPLYIYILYVNLHCPDCYDYFTAGYFFGILFFNSALNPVLYALTNVKIRGFYRRHFQNMRRRILSG